MRSFLPYGRQSVSETDIDAVDRVLRSDWLTQGPTVEDFERAICETVGAKHAVACNSGTAALHLAVMAAGLNGGDAAVVPAITFVATANVVRMTGADVVFADVDPDTGRVTVDTLAEALDRADKDGLDVKAVLPVHLTGAVSDPEQLARMASKAGAVVIEDACHAIGGSYRRSDGIVTTVGSCADASMACFSFHPVKPITTAEGGAVTTNDASLARQLRLFRSHGITRDEDEFENASLVRGPSGAVNPWYYEMHAVGLNYRIPDVLCALGLSQIQRLSQLHAKREKLVSKYCQRLIPLAPVVRPLTKSDGVVSGHHLFVVLVDFQNLDCDRGQVMRELRERGIGTQVHYIPVPWQPYYRARTASHDYPGAAEYYARCLSLPLFAGMSESDVDRVVSCLTEALGLS